MAIPSITRKSDFAALRQHGKQVVTKGFVFNTLPIQDSNSADCDMSRLGIITSRKIGNAVMRNRAKRRLKALAQNLLEKHGQKKCLYLLIARTACITRPYNMLEKDLKYALHNTNTFVNPNQTMLGNDKQLSN